ncbi:MULTISPECIES: NHLP family bacteriocin export ABC transporter peptidase/permease/ATPase subunit [unclassified Moorena]|uniref:NHLP family bacteriocin export ABC transporter peptidase/permease/ATPase subunit n=1 Tax=unclassified Moorena TaxID=2683338 RepID=UPI0013FEBBBA|nr:MULTISPECIES: NHLP family bacteriocin export ABC transporter peptidase/permease/ATPase subunit [unclassified Moorena]NEO11618.1 NHLP family bacteriocin export ABC transporter peptidase/permease/ATPase subunit [Moorena sp. SIO3E8]NEP99749.1 NHLP family bacteriocin export ABC transporter peptidase/permease/ATPase subunit [Moorena sp. SIO3F7]
MLTLTQSINTTISKRVRTPTLIQMEEVECGAASLGIILGYYHRFVPLPELRKVCGVSRDGSKASSVLKAARTYGLTAKGFKKSLENLKTLNPPFIIFWEFCHFLVVEGFGKNCVYLNDPETGPRKLSLEEFSQGYTGIVLVMEPGPEFKKTGKKTSIFSSLKNRLQTSHNSIIFSILVGLILTFPRLIVPMFSQVFVDKILIEDYQDWLRPMLLAMVITAIVQGLLARLQLKVLRRLLVKLSVSMSGQFVWHILRLPVGFYAQRFSGEISDRAQLNDRVADVISGRLATTIIDVIMMGLYALLMFTYDILLTTITILFASFNFIALQYLSRNRTDANISLAQEYGKVAGTAIGGIQSIETIKASGLESDLFTRFAGYYTKALNAQQKLGLQTQILNALPNLLTALATASILLIGGLRVIKGELTIGMLIAYQLLTSSFLKPINELINFGSTLQELEADINRLDDVLQNPIDEEAIRQPNQFARAINNDALTSDSFKLQGNVEFRNITFGYNRLESPLVEEFNLIIKPGQRIALVGSSGSGKSTIAKLACGLYVPWEGEILFDGIPRSQIPRAVLANSLAMVEQDIFLFAGTIRENLTLWDTTIPESDLVKSATDAAIHESILFQPKGYDAPLSEGGANLSGGQRQRLEIARALVRNPTILVLDEATSALDAETELIIDRNLRRRGCSCIVVAHRLSTIRDCDEIIVLDRGKVVQRGTHEQLRQETGTYQHLISSH